MTKRACTNTKRAGFLLSGPALVIVLSLATNPPSSAAEPRADLAAKPGALAGVSILSPSDGWAVGRRGTVDVPLAEHWNGSHWKRVPVAKAGSVSTLSGVNAVAPDDVWAVGSYQQGGVLRTLAEHWDGTKWTKVPADSPADQTNQLYSVSADSASDVWAAGYSKTASGVTKTLIERFDGSAWHQVASYDPGDNKTVRVLRSISAVSPTDVWAVGDLVPSGESQLPLIEHWNGTQWLDTPAPNPSGSAATYLYAVDALSATDVWAVGSYRLNGGQETTLVEHWDGTNWSIVDSPNGPAGSANVFTGVSVLSATDAWASGTSAKAGVVTPLIAHWDGSTWTRVSAETVPGSTATSPVAISLDGPKDGWFVGSYLDDGGTVRPLFERWNGKVWKVK